MHGGDDVGLVVSLTYWAIIGESPHLWRMCTRGMIFVSLLSASVDVVHARDDVCLAALRVCRHRARAG